MMCKASCDVFEPSNHASTFGGNPFVCAAALKVLETVESGGILQNVQARGEQLRTRLRAIATAYPQIFEEVRGWGLINGIEIKADADLTSIEVVKKSHGKRFIASPRRA